MYRYRGKDDEGGCNDGNYDHNCNNTTYCNLLPLYYRSPLHFTTRTTTLRKFIPSPGTEAGEHTLTRVTSSFASPGTATGELTPHT